MKVFRRMLSSGVSKAFFALVVVTVMAAFTQPVYGQYGNNGWNGDHGHGGVAPEIDPKALTGALTLLSGGLLLVTDRFRSSRAAK